MPTMPPSHRPPGWRSKAQRDAEYKCRHQDDPDRKFLRRRDWRDRLRPTELAREPYCRECKTYGLVVLATVANHKVPHRGNWDLFIGGELESLCGPCHDGEVQREEHAAMVAARRAGR